MRSMKGIFYFVICLTILSCQEKKPELEYKHVKEASLFNCGTLDSKIFEEALMEFEANIGKNYTRENTNLSYSYGQFTRMGTLNRANYNDLASEHALKVLDALKQVDGLWVDDPNNLTYNYEHPIFQCIADNIKDKGLNTTFHALLSTKSMNFRMLKDAILSKSRLLHTDKHLAMYVALELYYSKLGDVDLTQKKENNITDEKENDPHAGHNHD